MDLEEAQQVLQGGDDQAAQLQGHKVAHAGEKLLGNDRCHHVTFRHQGQPQVFGGDEDGGTTWEPTETHSEVSRSSHRGNDGSKGFLRWWGVGA